MKILLSLYPIFRSPHFRLAVSETRRPVEVSRSMAIHSRMPVIFPFCISSSACSRAVLRRSLIWFLEKYLMVSVVLGGLGFLLWPSSFFPVLGKGRMWALLLMGVFLLFRMLAVRAFCCFMRCKLLILQELCNVFFRINRGESLDRGKIFYPIHVYG